jgi:DNA-binding response OmpR family regulator
LIVEDDRAMARLERSALVRAGLEVSVVHSAFDAMVAVETEHYDLFVIDLFLPDGDGFALCQQLRQVYDTPTVIVSSLDPDIGAGLVAAEDGPRAFLPKPLAMADLVNTVHEVLAAA